MISIDVRKTGVSVKEEFGAICDDVTVVDSLEVIRRVIEGGDDSGRNEGGAIWLARAHLA